MQMVSMTEGHVPKGAIMVQDRYREPDPEDFRKLEKLFRVLEEFRKELPMMPTSYIMTYLQVAMRPGLGPTGYAPYLGTIQPIASRYLSEIGVDSRQREAPLHWVDREEDVENRRQKKFFLTAKGKALMRRVCQILEE